MRDFITHAPRSSPPGLAMGNNDSPRLAFHPAFGRPLRERGEVDPLIPSRHKVSKPQAFGLYKSVRHRAILLPAS